MAALTQLVSENKVVLDIDTSHPQSTRPALDWNSKKAGLFLSFLTRVPLNRFSDDDQIETVIQVCFRDLAIAVPSSDSINDPSLAAIDVNDFAMASQAHGRTVDGGPGCCKQKAHKGVIDCSACLDDLWAARSATLGQTELELARLILFLVGQAGKKGVTKQDLLVSLVMLALGMKTKASHRSIPKYPRKSYFTS